MTDVAQFRQMIDGSRADYELIARHEHEYCLKLPERILDSLQRLDGEHGMGGYPVSRYEHSLQSATRALRDGADIEYVVAALIHDIGDLSYMIETHTRDAPLLARADALLEEFLDLLGKEEPVLDEGVGDAFPECLDGGHGGLADDLAEDLGDFVRRGEVPEDALAGGFLEFQEGLDAEDVVIIVFSRSYNLLRYQDGVAGLAQGS